MSEASTPQMFASAQACLRSGDLPAAISIGRQILANPSNSPETYFELCALFHSMGRLDESIAACEKAIEKRPDFVEAWVNLGNLMWETAEIPRAMEAYQKAFTLRPTFSVALSNWLYCLHFLPESTSESIYREHLRWDELFGEPLRKTIQPHGNDPAPDRKLRIGYISPDFRSHPVGRFLMPLFTHHDRSKFEIFCYSDVRRPDSMTEAFRKMADGWRDTSGLSDEQVAKIVRDDKIDIFVDLILHMSGCRLGVFARKPAPVQVTYLAYCSTSGLKAMDGRISDPVLDPKGAGDPQYTEWTHRLPHSYWCYSAKPVAVNPPPVVRSGLITFGCLNTFAKVSPATWQAWRLILERIPTSRLIVHADEGSHRDRAKQRFQSAGIDPSRISFVGSVPEDQYFQQYNQFDIALDPFPYGGGTTTCDALWMGVPVVTLRGQTAVGRGGASILSNLKLTDLIATSAEEYVAVAMKLAGNIPRLLELRSKLQNRMKNSPLMDSRRFARDMEAIYRQAWLAWCGGGK